MSAARIYLNRLRGVCMAFLMFLGSGQAIAFGFYANYDVLFDGWDYQGVAGHHFNITVARLSGDGSRIAFAGAVRAPSSSYYNHRLFIVDFDGANLVEITLPGYADPGPNQSLYIYDLAINEDGSRLFVNTAWYVGKIFKVDITDEPVTAQVSQVYDLNSLPGGSPTTSIKTTATGDFVYFVTAPYFDVGGDVVKVSHTGGTPQTVVNDANVPAVDGSGWAVCRDGFDVSDDGKSVVFGLNGHIDATDVKRDWAGVYSLTGTGFEQISADEYNNFCGYAYVSGNGSKAVFWEESTDTKYISINTDGTGRVEFQDSSYNFAGASLIQNGTKIFYADNFVETGRIDKTDGSGGMQILPEAYNHVNVQISNSPEISNNGGRVAFVSGVRLYAGIFNPQPDWATRAPTIPSIDYDPFYVADDEDAPQLILTTQPDGGSTGIYRASLDNLLNGKYYDWEDLSYGFEGFRFNDNGDWDDAVAGDGVFTMGLWKSSTYTGPEIYGITTRVGAMDNDGNVTVADKILWRSTPDPTCTNIHEVSNFVSSFQAPLCTSIDWIKFDSTIIIQGTYLTIDSPVSIFAGEFSIQKGATLRIKNSIEYP